MSPNDHPRSITPALASDLQGPFTSVSFNREATDFFDQPQYIDEEIQPNGPVPFSNLEFKDKVGDDRLLTSNHTGWEASAFVGLNYPASSSMPCGDGKVCEVHGAALQNFYNPFLDGTYGFTPISGGLGMFEAVNYPSVNPTSDD